MGRAKIARKLLALAATIWIERYPEEARDRRLHNSPSSSVTFLHAAERAYEDALTAGYGPPR